MGEMLSAHGEENKEQKQRDCGRENRNKRDQVFREKAVLPDTEDCVSDLIEQSRENREHNCGDNLYRKEKHGVQYGLCYCCGDFFHNAPSRQSRGRSV